MSGLTRAIDVVTCDRKFMWAPGFYHSKRLKKHSLYNVCRTFCLTVFYILPVLILLFVIVEKPNIKSMLDEAMYFAGGVWFSAKISLHMYHMPKLVMLENLLGTHVFNMHTQYQNHFMSTAKNTMIYMLRGYWCVSGNVAIIFVLCPIVSKYYLTMPIWIPFAGEKLQLFAYIYESIYLILGIYIYPSIDSIFIGLILMAVAQVKVLKDNLKHSTDRDINDDLSTQEKKIQVRLRSCVIHHNAIRLYVSKLEEMLSRHFFWQVFFSGIEFCIIALKIFVEANNIQIVVLMFIFLSMIGETALYCWCGQQVINESSGITEACYLSEWYACTVPTRKVLLMIMTNSQEPIVLYAGKLFTISYETFINIVRNAYSYYIVFMQVYQA